jgi:DNA polymerase-3 subunit alpha
MEKQRAIFEQGAAERGVEPGTATYIFDLMEKFAGYGFNKSHSAAYALVSYQTLWLKTHYPAAFMAAVLSADMDNTDKVVMLIDECRSMGLKVEPPRINHSVWRFTTAGDKALVYGLGAIKGVGEAAIAAMLDARDADGPFHDIWDFCRRIDLHRANRRVLEALIRAGALDGLADNRATLMNQLPDAIALAEQQRDTEAAGQGDLFGALSDDPGTVSAPDPQIAARRWPDWDEDERLQGEKETLGLYLTGHPINKYDAELDAMVSQRIGRLVEGAQGNGPSAPGVTPIRADQRTVAGLVVAVRIGKTQRGRMASLTLDDRTGRIEVTVFSELFEETRALLVPDALLAITGTLNFDGFRDAWTLRASRIRTLAEARAELADHLLLRIDFSDPSGDAHADARIEQLAALLEPARGGALPIEIDLHRPGACGRLRLGGDWQVDPSDHLLKQLRNQLGTDAVEVVYRPGPRLRTPLPDPAEPPRLAVVR